MDNENIVNQQNQNLIEDQNQFPNQEEVQNNNQTPSYVPPPNNENDYQPAMPAANPPVQYPPYQPQTIYQQLNIPNPISEQNNNNIPPINQYPPSSGIYDYQSNYPPNNVPNIPIPQSVEEEEIPPEVQQQMNMAQPPNTESIPVETDQVQKSLLDEKIENERVNANINRNQIHPNVSDNCCDVCCECFCDCLGECCGEFCKCCEACITCECCDEQCCNDCGDFVECCSAICQVLLLCLSCLELCRGL